MRRSQAGNEIDVDDPQLTASALRASLADVEAGTAHDADYALIAEVLRTCDEATLDPGEAIEPAAVCAEAERALEVLLRSVLDDPNPNPMAVWALGWSNDRRVVPTLVALHRTALQQGDEPLAIRALRTAAGIAPRNLRDVILESSTPTPGDLSNASRHVARRWRSAVYDDLYGLSASELLAVATGPGDIATNAASALARRLQRYEHGRESEEIQPSAHEPLEWSEADLEAAFVGCLEHLERTPEPNPTMAYAAGCFRDKRAVPALTTAIQRGLESEQGLLVYYGVMALGTCGGAESVPTFELVAVEAEDATTASMAETNALRFSHEFFTISPRLAGSGSGRRWSVARWARWRDALRDRLPAALVKTKADRYVEGLRRILEEAGADEVQVVNPQRGRTSEHGPPIPLPDPIPARLSLEQAEPFVRAYLRREIGCTLRTSDITVRLWPMLNDVVHVRVRSDADRYRRIIERIGLRTADLDPARF